MKIKRIEVKITRDLNLLLRYDVMYVYLLDYTEKELKFASTDATFLLSVIGIINTAGEVIIGFMITKALDRGR